MYTALALTANAGYTFYDGGDVDTGVGYAYAGALSMFTSTTGTLGKKIVAGAIALCIWLSRAGILIYEGDYSDVSSTGNLVNGGTAIVGIILSVLNVCVQVILKKRSSSENSEHITPVKLRFLV